MSIIITMEIPAASPREEWVGSDHTSDNNQINQIKSIKSNQSPFCARITVNNRSPSGELIVDFRLWLGIRVVQTVVGGRGALRNELHCLHHYDQHSSNSISISGSTPNVFQFSWKDYIAQFCFCDKLFMSIQYQSACEIQNTSSCFRVWNYRVIISSAEIISEFWNNKLC